MKIRKSLIIPALIAAAVPATWAIAQGGPGMPGGMGGMGGFGFGPKRDLPSPEVLGRLEDGRIAMAKTALKLTDEQQKLWAPLEVQLRALSADRRKRMDEMRQDFEKRRAERQAQQAPGTKQDGTAPAQRPSMADAVERMSQNLSQRAERMKAFSAAFKPFYDSLNDEQKEVARIVLRDLRGPEGPGRHHMRRHHWAMGGPMGPWDGPGMRGGDGPQPKQQ